MLADSYIFDMDGTLWDAVDSYCSVWNRTIEQLGVDCPPVQRDALLPMMGLPIETIYDRLVGKRANAEEFNKVLSLNEHLMMPQLGGRLYPGVRQTFRKLTEAGARLFMISNCGASGIPNFLTYTGLTPFITDWLSIGLNGKDKTENIGILVERYKLKTPVYIGDTEGDCRSTHAAGIPFVWAAYGFGRNVVAPDYTIHSITELTELPS